jgi:hypothetical protein
MIYWWRSNDRPLMELIIRTHLYRRGIDAHEFWPAKPGVGSDYIFMSEQKQCSYNLLYVNCLHVICDGFNMFSMHWKHYFVKMTSRLSASSSDEYRTFVILTNIFLILTNIFIILTNPGSMRHIIWPCRHHIHVWSSALSSGGVDELTDQRIVFKTTWKKYFYIDENN